MLTYIFIHISTSLPSQNAIKTVGKVAREIILIIIKISGGKKERICCTGDQL